MKVLLIGLGGIGQRHARNLRALIGSELELIAYRTRRRPGVITPSLSVDESRNVEIEYGIRSFDSLESALAEHPAVAFVCNPTSLHMEAAIKCAAAGCDLFIEKPLASNLNNVERLLDLVRANALVVMIGYQLRFHPCIPRLRSLLKDDAIGSLLAVRAIVGEYLPYWHRYEKYEDGYAARADLGGGVLLSQIHDMDYLYSFFGVPHRLFAAGGHWSSLQIDVEDVASVMMQFSWRERDLPVHLQMDYLQYPPKRQCELLGESGKVLVDFVSNELMISLYAGASSDTMKFEGFDRNQLFLDELRHFLRCVTNREQPEISLEDGIQSLRMAVAAKKSMITGQMVDLDLVKQGVMTA